MVGGRQFEADLPGRECTHCGAFFESGQAAIDFDNQIIVWLVTHGFSSPEEIRFVRRASGLRAADIGSLLDVAPETISRWENGKQKPDASTLLTLGALALDAIKGSTETRDKLRVLREPSRDERVSIHPGLTPSFA